MWIIIDGNNWFSRAFYASNDSRSTGTVLQWLADTQKQLSPERIVVCWDSPSNFRKTLWPAYKEQRHEKPAGFFEHLSALRSQLAINDYEQYESTDHEADDLMAGLSQAAIDQGEKCLLCSSDKDLHQCLTAGLVSQCVRISRPIANRLAFQVLTADGLFKEYGVHPWQWVDYLCITGDSSDGIPGAPGLGPKSARDILVACGSIDGFYADPNKAPLSVKRRNSMLAFKSQIPLMRNLITLRLEAYKHDSGE